MNEILPLFFFPAAKIVYHRCYRTGEQFPYEQGSKAAELIISLINDTSTDSNMVFQFAVEQEKDDTFLIKLYVDIHLKMKRYFQKQNKCKAKIGLALLEYIIFVWAIIDAWNTRFTSRLCVFLNRLRLFHRSRSNSDPDTCDLTI